MIKPKFSSLKVGVEEKKVNIDFGATSAEIELGNVKVISSEQPKPYYNGAYTVDPTFETQVLETKQKVMKQDVTVNPIEVSRTSNQSGGVTVYIGGNISG